MRQRRLLLIFMLFINITFASSAQAATIFVVPYQRSAEVSGCLPEAVAGFAISPDGTLIAAHWGLGVVRIWDSLVGTELYTLPNLLEASSSPHIVFSPDSKLIAVYTSTDAEIWDARSGDLILTFDYTSNFLGLRTDTVYAKFSPDSKFIFIGSNQLITRWNLTSGTLIRDFPTNFRTYDRFDLSANGQILLVGNFVDSEPYTSLIKWQLVDVDTGEKLFSFPDSYAAAFVPGRSLLLILNGEGMSTLELWDLHPIRQLKVQNSTVGWATYWLFSNDGRRVFIPQTPGPDSSWSLFDVDSLSAIMDFQLPNAQMPILRFLPNNEQIIVRDYPTEREFDLPQLRVVNIKAKSTARVFGDIEKEFDTIHRDVGFFEVSPQKSELFIADFEGNLRSYDLNTGKLIHEFC